MSRAHNWSWSDYVVRGLYVMWAGFRFVFETDSIGELKPKQSVPLQWWSGGGGGGGVHYARHRRPFPDNRIRRANSMHATTTTTTTTVVDKKLNGYVLNLGLET